MDANIEYRVMLVDNPRADDRLIQRLLAEPGGKRFQFVRVLAYIDAIYLVRSQDWDAVLVNHDIGRRTGLELVHNIWLWDLRIPLLLLSDHYEPHLEYKSRTTGATDYCNKDSLTTTMLLKLIEKSQGRRTETPGSTAFTRLRKRFSALLPAIR